MIPILLGGAAILGGVFLVHRKFSCKEDHYASTKNCLVCGMRVCEEHGADHPDVFHRGEFVQSAGRCCSNHESALKQKVDARIAEIDRHFEILERAEKVQLFSKNFKGKMPPLRLNKPIKTAYHKDQSEAEKAIRFKAAENGCDVVQDLSFESMEKRDDNFIFREWAARGML